MVEEGLALESRCWCDVRPNSLIHARWLGVSCSIVLHHHDLSPPLPPQGRVCPPLVSLSSVVAPWAPSTSPPHPPLRGPQARSGTSSPAPPPRRRPTSLCIVTAVTSPNPASLTDSPFPSPVALHAAPLLPWGSPRWWCTPQKRRRRRCSTWEMKTTWFLKQANTARLSSGRFHALTLKHVR